MMRSVADAFLEFKNSNAPPLMSSRKVKISVKNRLDPFNMKIR